VRHRTGPPPGLVSEPIPWQLAVPFVLIIAFGPMLIVYQTITMDPTSPLYPIFRVMAWFAGSACCWFWLSTTITLLQMRKEERELIEYRKEIYKLTKRGES
jgi:hypothetical protein